MNAGNIVIVEDEFLVALQLEDILLELDYQVTAIAPDKAAAEATSTPAL